MLTTCWAGYVTRRGQPGSQHGRCAIKPRCADYFYVSHKEELMRHRTIRSLLLSALSLLALSGYAIASDEKRIDNIPMYGQPAISRPDSFKKADEDFIKQASEGLGSREAASKAWYAQAEQFLAKGDLDLAMRRYNQSWLLNPNNYQPYWGFGRVMLQRGKIDEAIQFLEKAKLLADDQFQKVGLLSDLGSAYSAKAENTPSDQTQDKARLFSLANQNFSESTTLDPTYGNSWRRWAMSLFEQDNFAGAWGKVKQARMQNARPFPPAFLRALEQKLPEPN
jgi:tetratricopeptide (TPR) repeat protein